MPPNVFPFEHDGLAAKYAVLSEADFARLNAARRRATSRSGRGSRSRRGWSGRRTRRRASARWRAVARGGADAARATPPPMPASGDDAAGRVAKPASRSPMAPSCGRSGSGAARRDRRRRSRALPAVRGARPGGRGAAARPTRVADARGGGCAAQGQGADPRSGSPRRATTLPAASTISPGRSTATPARGSWSSPGSGAGRSSAALILLPRLLRRGAIR